MKINILCPMINKTITKETDSSKNFNLCRLLHPHTRGGRLYKVC